MDKQGYVRPKSLRRRVWLAQWLLRLGLWLLRWSHLFTSKAYGREHIPKRGAAIIAPKHNSILDPLFVHGALRRNIAFISMAELFRFPLSLVLTWSGQIPVIRRNVESGARALEGARHVALNGGLVGIFPEGRIDDSPDSDELPSLQKGVIRMAYDIGAPIIPTGVCGTQHIKPKRGNWRIGAHAVIRFGDPIVIDREHYPTLESAYAHYLPLLARRLKELSQST